MFLSLYTMKKLSAFILLLLHINFCMLIPQMEDFDFEVSDLQIDDINSLIEYVDQVVLENPDVTPGDEDDDTARNYILAQITFYCNQYSIGIPTHDFSRKEKNFFPEFAANKIPSISFDIVAPP